MKKPPAQKMPEAESPKNQWLTACLPRLNVRFRYNNRPFLMVCQFLVVEDCPEQIQLKLTVPQIHIRPLTLIYIVNLRQPHVVAEPNSQSNGALVSKAQSPRKLRAVRQTPDALIFPGRVADIKIDFRPRLQIKSAGEPDLRHNGDR